MLCLRTLLLFTLLALPTAAMAGNPQIELILQDRKLEGQSLAHDKSHCVLLTCDGQIETVDLSEVKTFRKVRSSFKPWNTTKFRHQLLTEFGRGFQVEASRHYLVCGQGQDLKRYTEVLETLYRSFYLHFRTRGFDIEEPQLTQVVILFPDYPSFAQYARKDGVAVSRQLRGYYSPRTNRIALWQSSGSVASLPSSTGSHASGVFGSINSDLTSTLIHEATHQAAFNLGLHSRTSQTPRWIVEGLATNFEIQENLKNSKRLDPFQRINRERYIHFRNYQKSRRSTNPFEAFLSSDRPFEQSMLDAYSEAWALTFFLLEKRSRDYAKFLKRVAEHEEMSHYTAKDRLEDFRSVFGRDLQKLERDYLSFITSLE